MIEFPNIENNTKNYLIEAIEKIDQELRERKKEYRELIRRRNRYFQKLGKEYYFEHKNEDQDIMPINFDNENAI